MGFISAGINHKNALLVSAADAFCHFCDLTAHSAGFESATRVEQDVYLLYRVYFARKFYRISIDGDTMSLQFP